MPMTRRTVLASALALGTARLAAQTPLPVAAVYTVPLEQQWVSRIDLALRAAAARGEIAYVFSERVANTDYEHVLRQYAQAGHRLIVGESFIVEDAARAVARDFPGIAFLMGSSGAPQAPNFSVFDNYIQEPAYLSGMIAGGLSKSGRIGLVGGHPLPEVNRLMNAFIAGVRDTNPNAGFMLTFIDSWFDPERARAESLAMIDQGADVLYAERFGVSAAARERGVLAIGNVIDTQADYPDTVVVSALWHMGPTIDAAVAAVREGRFTAEDYGRYSLMRFGGAELSPLGSFANRVPSALMARVEQRRREMLDGTFVVEVIDTTPAFFTDP